MCNPDALVAKARSIPKMDGTDLARVVSTKSIYTFDSRPAQPDPAILFSR